METKMTKPVAMLNKKAGVEKDESSDLIYGIDDTPDIVTTTVLGFQNVITSFGGLVAVPLVIAGMAGFGVTDTAYLVSAALLVSGIVSIIQSKGIGPKFFRVGAGLPDRKSVV